ncbi:MAG: PAS domain-containing protein, partial [Desulfovibrionaceae bacterium]
MFSYHRAEWSDNIYTAWQAVLGDRPGVDTHAEYMDTKRRDDPEYLDLLARLYRAKYADMPLALVLTADDAALRFALAHQADLFHGAPIVFCGVNNYDPALLAGHPEVTGVVERGDFRETLARAFLMRPGTRRIFVITDATPTAQVNLANFQEALRGYPDVACEILQDLSADDLAQRLADLPEDSFAFFISFWRDAQGRMVQPARLGEMFRQAGAPVFGRSEWLMGLGLTGGMCVRGQNQGAVSAGLAERIMGGESASDMPVITESPNQFMFDLDQLRRHGIPERLIPEGAVVLHRPPSFYERNRPLVWAGGTVIAVLGVLVLALWGATMRLRRTRDRLRQSEDKFWRAFALSPVPMAIFRASDGRILEANDSCLQMLEHEREEALGRTTVALGAWLDNRERTRFYEL